MFHLDAGWVLNQYLFCCKKLAKLPVNLQEPAVTLGGINCSDEKEVPMSSSSPVGAELEDCMW